MNFDITQLPPSQADIDQEREGLQTEIKKLKKNVLKFSTVFFTLSLITIIPLWMKGFIGGTDAVFLIIAAAAAAAGVAAAAAGTDVFVVAAVFLAAGGVAGVAVGTVAVAVAAAAAIAGYLNEKWNSNLDMLEPLPDKSDQCVAIVAACKLSAECDAYMLALARQSRPTIIAEAKAIIDWHNTADLRLETEEEKRESQEAWQKLKSGVSLREG